MGPMGLGPMSGRAAGYCGGTDSPASTGLGRDRRWGFGRGGSGRGRGFGRRWRGGLAPSAERKSRAAISDPPLDAEAERQALRSWVDALREQLRRVESRLAGSDEKKEGPE
jgi:hypothetical protein